MLSPKEAPTSQDQKVWVPPVLNFSTEDKAHQESSSTISHSVGRNQQEVSRPEKTEPVTASPRAAGNGDDSARSQDAGGAKLEISTPKVVADKDREDSGSKKDSESDGKDVQNSMSLALETKKHALVATSHVGSSSVVKEKKESQNDGGPEADEIYVPKPPALPLKSSLLEESPQGVLKASNNSNSSGSKQRWPQVKPPLAPQIKRQSAKDDLPPPVAEISIFPPDDESSLGFSMAREAQPVPPTTEKKETSSGAKGGIAGTGSDRVENAERNSQDGKRWLPPALTTYGEAKYSHPNEPDKKPDPPKLNAVDDRVHEPAWWPQAKPSLALQIERKSAKDDLPPPVAEISVFPPDDESSLGSMGFLFASVQSRSRMVAPREEQKPPEPLPAFDEQATRLATMRSGAKSPFLTIIKMLAGLQDGSFSKGPELIPARPI
jgi:hypothetical protein